MSACTVFLSAQAYCQVDHPTVKQSNPWAAALGGSGAQAVFSTYMSIAELADLYGSKAYDKTKALELANMYQKLTDSAKASLTDLMDSGKVSASDQFAVQQMVVINDLLGRTAQSISAYIKEPTDDNEAVYERNRKKSWKALAKFLGVPANE